MFGIKIIKEHDYQWMLHRQEQAESALEEVHKKCERLESDCKSLRQQLNDKIAKCRKLKQSNDALRQFKRDTLDAMTNIDFGSFRVEVCKSKCDTCDNEPADCRKYTFGKHAFCLVPKQ